MTIDQFSIDPDIRKASTPPSWVYTDPKVYELARTRIFQPSWQFVADVQQVRIPLQVQPFVLLEGCLDEPLLLTRDAKDQLHCVSNVCTHRGNIVCQQGGVEPMLRCRYHGRRFQHDGGFVSMPEFHEVENFPTGADDLHAVALDRLGPLLFSSLGPHATFAEWIGPLSDRIGWLQLDDLEFDAGRSRDYLVRANWALYCENYLEGFHIPYVHASLNETIDYGDYRVELHRWSSLQLALSKGGEHAFCAPSGHVDHGLAVAAYYFWLFPNLMLNFYPWGLSINVVKPLAVDRTRVSFLTFVSNADKLDFGAGSQLDRVEREDEAVVEAVQRGLRSRLYSRGRYSPSREQATHHFHRLLQETLALP